MNERTYRCHHCLDTGTIRITGPDEVINGRTVRGQVSARRCNYCVDAAPVPATSAAEIGDDTVLAAQWRTWKLDNPTVWLFIVRNVIGDAANGRASLKRTFEEARAKFRVVINNDYTALASRDITGFIPALRPCIEQRVSAADREVA